MGLLMKEVGKITKLMVLGNLFTLMVTYTKVIGKGIKPLVEALILVRFQVVLIEENGKMICSMEKV